MVEYALILPLFLFLVFSIIEFSVLFFSFVTVSNAAREGARAGIVVASDACDQGCIDALVETAARRLLTGLADEALAVIVTHPDPGVVRVEVRYRADLLTRMIVEAFGGQGHLDLSATSTMGREE